MCKIHLIGKFSNSKDSIVSCIEKTNNKIILTDIDKYGSILKLTNSNKIGLLILDGSVDNIYDIVNDIKIRLYHRDIPILVVVGDTSKKNKLLNLGVESVVVEPVDIVEFNSQLNLLIRLKNAELKISSKENGISLNEMKFKDLFNTMTNAFCFYKVIYNEDNLPIDYIFVEMNPSFENILGQKSYDVVGKSLRSMMNKNDEYWMNNFNSVVITNKSTQFIGYHTPLNKWFDVRAYLSKNKYLVMILSDITNEKEMNNKVTKISKELDQILNVTSPLRVVDYNHIVLLVNDSFCNLFHIKREDVVGKHCNDISQFNSCGTLCPVKQTKRFCGKKTFEITTKLKNGKNIKCLVSTRPFENSENKIIGIVETFTDITKLKDVENRLIRAKRKAEESDKLKSAFLANMSHEIRTPMNSIIGFSDLLNESDIDEQTKKDHLEIIQNAGNDLLKLIDDIIDIAKIEAGQLNIKMESIQVDKLLSETYMMLKNNSTLKSNRVKIKLINEAGIKPDFILTDGLRLKQILINIVNNAIKFTHTGTIEFGYTIKESVLEFHVTDTGIGLTPEQIGIIWERFRQADDSTTKKYGGNGLGLSISKGLVKLLGGEIWVESVLNKGTTFKFTIPYISAMCTREKMTKKVRKTFDWRGYTILVAEDVDINFVLISEILKYTGVNVIRARDGQECVDLYDVNKNLVDLILLDIQMPILNGYETMRIIKKINKNIPIIVQTAYAMNDDIKKSYDAGCDDYITKPMTRDNLLNKINNLMYNKN